MEMLKQLFLSPPTWENCCPGILAKRFKLILPMCSLLKHLSIFCQDEQSSLSSVAAFKLEASLSVTCPRSNVAWSIHNFFFFLLAICGGSHRLLYGNGWVTLTKVALLTSGRDSRKGPNLWNHQWWNAKVKSRIVDFWHERPQFFSPLNSKYGRHGHRPGSRLMASGFFSIAASLLVSTPQDGLEAFFTRGIRAE